MFFQTFFKFAKKIVKKQSRQLAEEIFLAWGSSRFVFACSFLEILRKIQDFTDKQISELEKRLEEKEKEIMKI